MSTAQEEARNWPEWPKANPAVEKQQRTSVGPNLTLRGPSLAGRVRSCPRQSHLLLSYFSAPSTWLVHLDCFPTSPVLLLAEVQGRWSTSSLHAHRSQGHHLLVYVSLLDTLTGSLLTEPISCPKPPLLSLYVTFIQLCSPAHSSCPFSEHPLFPQIRGTHRGQKRLGEGEGSVCQADTCYARVCAISSANIPTLKVAFYLLVVELYGICHVSFTVVVVCVCVCG